ncbi:Protein of unknown function [Pseudomonas asplenii]|uniref:DUF1493 family protein n=1 Tax=Pseudomonas asplenii TaxID=53407 RepID=A0A1H1ZZ49_9PSED|nr:DUF1493 family protein [Pseudomonas asplenii]SDT39045.1 Protein of unknown function [Pseudomonas asplenii]
MKPTSDLPDDESMKQLIQLLDEHIGLPKHLVLNLGISVNHDLHCDGDDAAELLEVLQKRFPIRFIDYDAYRYFRPEGYDLFFWRRPQERRGKIPLTLGMLYHAINLQRWDTAELESLRL